jgi:diacylglycerol kinase family enzyme
VPGIGVITNPRSKANLRDPKKMRQLGYLLGSAGSPYATKTLDDLYRAAEEFKQADIDILGINGGDGTIHVTLTAFAQVYGDSPLPRVAILPGGTLNTIAAGIGLRGKPGDVLYEVIERYHQGEELRCVERNLLRVGDKVGFIFGNGLVANFLEAYYATGKPSPATGAKLVAHAVLGAIFRTALAKRLFKRWVGQVSVDGEGWARHDFSTITGATVTEIGIGFKPFYRTLERPDHFAILGIHCSPVSLALELGRIHRGQAIRRDKVISQVARTVTLASEEPFSYTIDGDLYSGARELTLSAGPRVKLVLP